MNISCEPADGIKTNMPFILPALRADISAFVRRYLRPWPQISLSLPADIAARGLSRYIRIASVNVRFPFLEYLQIFHSFAD